MNFLSSSVVKIRGFRYRDHGLVPGWGGSACHWPKQQQRQQQGHLKKVGECVVRAGCKEGVGCKGKDSSLRDRLSLLSKWPRTTVTRYGGVRSVCPTPSHGRWPSSSMDASTAVLPSSHRNGCCLQPTAKLGMKA